MRRSMANKILLLAGCVVLALSFAGEVKAAQKKALVPLTVALVDLENVYVGKEPAKEPIVVDMLFSISNPNSIRVDVDQLEWAVRVEGKRLATLAVPEGIYIPAKGEAKVRKTFVLNSKTAPVNLLLSSAVLNLEEGAKVFDAIANAIKDQKAHWELEGTAYVDSKLGSMSVPFRAEWKAKP
jgi:LEA14-like dessication related protein